VLIQVVYDVFCFLENVEKIYLEGEKQKLKYTVEPIIKWERAQ
jgi:hypothetical protein